MSPHRRPVSLLQAMFGSLALVAGVAIVVGLAHALALPSQTLEPLEPPELEDVADRRPGEVVCPTGEELNRRGEPMPVTSAELIECPSLFDGETVRYEGEAVGAVLLRPTHAWLHLNDDPYGLRIGPISTHRTAVGGNSGMAVSVPRDVGAQVRVGGYRSHGTGVAVIGTFERASREDGGAPAIDATDVRIVRDARAFTHLVSVRRVVTAAVVAAVAIALLAVVFVRRRRANAARMA